ncbi:MAG: hypothetical protein KGY74_05245 [Candidatus Cloacimonetes bacterium]|nr:hypothetical protein [Candidatus Cloacimonadota bacterium]
MANINWRIKLIKSDGSLFSTANVADAMVRLRESDVSGADLGAYGQFTEVGNGLWEIEVGDDESGFYLVQISEDAGVTYSNVDGYAPKLLILNEVLTLANAQTVSGNKTFSGDNILSGDNSVTGTIDVVASGFKIGGTIVSVTAAELNILDGATLTTAELNRLAGNGTTLDKLLTDATAESISAPSKVQETDTHVVISVDEIADSDGNALVGKYRFQYVFNNTASDTPSATDSEIISGDNTVKIEKPNTGDSVYDSTAYLHVRVQFENATGNTGWSIVLDTSVTEPESTLTDAGVIEELASGTDNATAVLRAIVNLISDNSTIGRIMAEEKKHAYLSGSGAPSVSADYVGQWYLDTSNENWYKAIDTGNETRADDWTQL